MAESQSVIVVRLTFLRQLESDSLLSKNQLFPVLMELSGLVFDQVYEALLRRVLKKPQQPYLLLDVPKFQPAIPLMGSPFKFMPLFLPTHLSRLISVMLVSLHHF